MKIKGSWKGRGRTETENNRRETERTVDFGARDVKIKLIFTHEAIL